MKRIIFTICLLGIMATAHAQVSITPRVGFAMPQGLFDNIAGNGFGYGLDLDYAINDKLRIGASAGQYLYNAEVFGININAVDFAITPVTTSIKYLLPATTLRPYIGIEGGMYHLKIDAAGFNTTRQYFGIAPTLGLLYPVNEKIDFFASAQYHIMYLNETIPIGDFQIKQDIKFIPLNLGFTFKF
ncbi:outer membrane beta-barrel protein [Porifericola rhodea]|uniref:outer membrane beta-barrel protein n=1 Tax=Porifericola rhodea TaxID=930972 RepID=UPI002666F8CC|nr:outer membrane beta-barrel protein [Porifericola rhodea]WKN33633.1 outer membrane beta-barrel protein [Porifericola rhodea]